LPIVTIGICVKNREDLIGDALKSIAKQVFPHDLMEIIIVDDGSTDRTLSVVKSQVQELQLTAKIIHQDWKGLGPTRNVVLRNATGKHVIWVDSDMILSKDFVRIQVDFMENNPEVGIAKGSYGIYPANIVSTLENLDFVTTNSKRMNNLDPNTLGTGGSIYRIQAIQGVGGFNEDIKGSGEDADAEYRIRKAGWILERTSAIFFERRRSTWHSIWNEYFWHGKGSMQVIEGRTVKSRYKFFPPFAIFIECFRVIVAYKMTGRKVALLLPLHYMFKRTAWLVGLLFVRFVEKPSSNKMT